MRYRAASLLENEAETGGEIAGNGGAHVGGEIGVLTAQISAKENAINGYRNRSSPRRIKHPALCERLKGNCGDLAEGVNARLRFQRRLAGPGERRRKLP